MKLFLFVFYQMVLFSIAVVTNIFSSKHIGPPLGYEDFITAGISIPIYILAGYGVKRLYGSYQSIKFRKKISLSALAILLAIIILATIDNLWFEYTGNMLF